MSKMIELITTIGKDTVTFEGVYTSDSTLPDTTAPDTVTVCLGRISAKFLTEDQIEQIRQVMKQGIVS